MLRSVLAKALAFLLLTALPAAATGYTPNASSAPISVSVQTPPGMVAAYHPEDNSVKGTVSYTGNLTGYTISLFLDGAPSPSAYGTTDALGVFNIPTPMIPPGIQHSIYVSVTATQVGAITQVYTPVPTQSAPYTLAGTNYYVSAAGSDSNNGTSTSTPWLTTTKVQAGAYHPNDTISFRGGDSFTGCLTFNASNVPNSFRTNAFLINSYGTGKATITSNCGSAGSGTMGGRTALLTIDGVSGSKVDSLILRGSGFTTPTQYGVLIENGASSTNQGVADNITVSNSDISGFGVTTAATSDYGAEIFILGYSFTGGCGSLADVSVLNNKLHGATVTAQDDAGRAGYGCGLNIYNEIAQGNEVYNMGGRVGAQSGTSGNGYVPNGVNGFLAQYNVVHDNGANTTNCGGPGGLWDYSTNNALVQFNEIYNQRPTNNSQSQGFGGGGCDWAALDADSYTNNSVYQYNYTHDNAGPSVLLYTGGGSGWFNNTFRYNVSQNDQYLASDGGGVFALDPASGMYIYNNTIYSAVTYASAGPHCFSSGYNGGYGPPVVVANNICYQTTTNSYTFDGGSGAILTSAAKVYNNLYYRPNATQAFARWSDNTTGGTAVYSTLAAFQAGSNKELGSIIGDPKFANPGGGATIASFTGPQPGPSAYILNSGSPALGAGIPVTTLGIAKAPLRDYYGSGIPSTAPDIGAWQTPGTPIPPILAALSLSPITGSTTSLYTGTIGGKTAGSTITATSSDGTVMTVNGAGTQVTGNFTGSGTPQVTLTEALAGAQNTPRSSSQGIQVGAPPLITYTFTGGTLPSGVTASGAAGGTAPNSSGFYVSATSPRFFYSGGSAQGLLAEPASTNVLLQSNSLAVTAIWPGYGNVVVAPVVTANATTSPDGTADAASIAFPNFTYAGNSRAASQLQQNITTMTNGTQYTLSGLFKGAVGTETAYMYAVQNASPYAIAGSKGCALTTGWTKCSFTFTANAASMQFDIGFNGYIPGVANHAAETIYAWGMQLEAGTTATTPMPTTTATASRTADVISATIPSGVAHLKYTFPDATTYTQTVTPGAFTFPTPPVAGQPVISSMVGSN